MAAKKKAVWIVESRESKNRAWLPYENFSGYFNTTRKQANEEKDTLVKMADESFSSPAAQFRVARYERTWAEADTK